MREFNIIKNKKIYIAGHRGMVGSSLISYLKKYNINRLIYSEKKLNLLDKKKVANFIKNHKPDIIINCAGRVGRNFS